MRVVAACLLSALVAPAFGQSHPAPGFDGCRASTRVATSVAVCIDGVDDDALSSSVLMPRYYDRVRAEQREIQARFGLHAVHGVAFESSISMDQAQGDAASAGTVRREPFVMRQSPTERLAGLRYDRDDVFVPGDRISIRAASDMQLLAKAAGLAQAPESTEALALLGLRSRVQFTWQVGDAGRALHWEAGARIDRRKDEVTSVVTLRMLRRF
ncbi:MAG TPA: hypothetical protein VMU33_13445 [Burkholderiaceae bacterium]|nr:hypothetical protein [Burkholderiaceae bacterium]